MPCTCKRRWRGARTAAPAWRWWSVTRPAWETAGALWLDWAGLGCLGCEAQPQWKAAQAAARKPWPPPASPSHLPLRLPAALPGAAACRSAPCLPPCRADHVDFDVLVYTNSYAEKEAGAEGGSQACHDRVAELFRRVQGDVERQRAVINIDGAPGGSAALHLWGLRACCAPRLPARLRSVPPAASSHPTAAPHPAACLAAVCVVQTRWGRSWRRRLRLRAPPC